MKESKKVGYEYIETMRELMSKGIYLNTWSLGKIGKEYGNEN